MDALSTVIALAYLLAAVLFILGLRYLSSPATARRGNLLAAIAMLIAILMTLLDRQIIDFKWIAIAMIIGTLIGVFSARLVKMTAMPQMVGLFNGLGGGASALVAFVEFNHQSRVAAMPVDLAITTLLSVFIGALTFTGSMVAFGKLQGMISGSPITFKLQKPVNAAMMLAVVILSIIVAGFQPSVLLFSIVTLIALILGVMLVIPIGGADMPVVISLLNSFSGLAACATGFVVQNDILIIAGALVGAAGLILTEIMCKAMNRSLSNVLFGAFGTGDQAAGATTTAGGDKSVKSVDNEEAAMIVGYAQSVVVVPGFGMAAAMAQHAVRELSELLIKRGVEVKFAIHPVAGRMPGHMNVLLAEANVPYNLLFDMDDINPEFPHTDVVLVIGANDVINPAARTDTSSPIYGMPILDVDKARHIIIIKRSLNVGFAGVDNELFYNPKAMMYFGSAKEKVQDLVAEIKKL